MKKQWTVESGQWIAKSFRAGLRLALLLCAVHCALSTSTIFGQNKVTVTGTLDGPDGSPANGFLSVLATNPFTSSDGFPVFMGPPIHIAISNGSFSTALIPNAGSYTASCTAAGALPGTCSYYTAVFNLTSTLGNAQYTQTWLVPASGPVAFQTMVQVSPPAPSFIFPFAQLAPPAGCTASQFPEWTGSGWTCSNGGSSSPLTTEGDIYYYHSSANARLPIGSNGLCLTSNGTGPAWASCSTGSGTVTSSGSPLAGNIPKFTTATNIAPAAASDIANLFSGCSGTKYLGADGACHTPSSGGSLLQPAIPTLSNAVTDQGDSITLGQSPVGNYVNDLAGLTGWSTTNDGVNGNQCADAAVPVFALTITPASLFTLMIGTNDQRHYGVNATEAAQYQSCLGSLLVWLATPNADLLPAQSSNITYTGTWSNASLYPGVIKYASSSGATATNAVPLVGDTVYISYDIYDSCPSSGVADVQVDGVDYGHFNCASASPVSTINADVVSPQLIRIHQTPSGQPLAWGPHTITITTQNSGDWFLNYLASNGGVQGTGPVSTPTGPFIYNSNIIPEGTAGYLSGGSEPNLDFYNSMILSVDRQLASDHLNVVNIDSYSSINPLTMLNSDGIHPNNSGATSIANAFYTPMQPFVFPMDRMGASAVRYDSNGQMLLGPLQLAQCAPGTVAVGVALNANANCTTPVVNPQVSLTGLLAYWKFDEDTGTVVNDATGQGYAGTFTGDAWTTGIVNSAGSFSGSTEVAVSQAFPTLNDFSMAGWLKTSATNITTSEDVAIEYGGGSRFGLGVSVCAHEFGFEWFAGGTVCGSTHVDDEAWHFVVFTRAGTTGTVYVDGSSVGSGTIPNTQISPTANGFALGGPILATGFTNNFSGALDEWSVWSRALSSSDVTNLYNSGAGLQFPFPTPQSTTVNTQNCALGASCTITADLPSTPSQCSGNNFATGVATTGAANCSQPAFSNLSGAIALAQTPVLDEGDMLYVNAAPALARLGIGTNGQCLTSNGSTPAWGSCASGSGVTIETNSSNNSSQTSLNFESSTANAVGLTVTPSNPSGGIEKLEITGASYGGNAATATALASTPGQCGSYSFATGIAASGNANCSTQGWTARNVSISTDTILSGDVAGGVKYTDASGSAVTLPTATTLGNSIFATTLVNASAGAVTVTPTTWGVYVNGGGSPQSTLTIASGQRCFLGVDAAGSEWDAFCTEPQIAAGTNITLTRSSTGLTIAETNSATTVNSQTCTLGSTCTVTADLPSTPSQCSANNFATGVAVSGNANCAQPAFSNLSGALSAAQCLDPTASTLGCIESLASASHKWINMISPSGVPSATQPASTDLSDYGSIPSAALANDATTVNGQTCTLGSTCTVSGAESTKTSSYALAAGDLGKLVVMNCTSSCTVTLYGSPTNGYYGAIESIGSTVATVSLNSLDFNGSTSVPVLNSYVPVSFWSDGTNYFGGFAHVAGTGISFTPAANGLTITNTEPMVYPGAGLPISTGSGWGSSLSVTNNDFVCGLSSAFAVNTLSNCAGSQMPNYFFAAPNGSSGDPIFRAIVGADLPDPSSTTLGGVESLAAASHKWINTISPSGVLGATQPASTDLSDYGSVSPSGLLGSSNDATTVNGQACTLGSSCTVATGTANQPLVGGGASSAPVSGFALGSGTGTSGALACVTASNTMGNCTSLPPNNFIGVFNSTLTYITAGIVSVLLDATENVTYGDNLCASSTGAHQAHDNGSTACTTGEWIGVVTTTASSVSSATVSLKLQ